MLGIFFAFLSSAFSELSDSIGKRETSERVYSHYSFGFLSVLGGALLLIITGFIRDDFAFSLASLPTFLPRLVLEVLQAHVTIRAIVRADRSDFGHVRTLTIPLLLVADLILGYGVGVPQMLGMGIIFCTVFFLLSYEHFKTRGLFLLVFTAINAAVTISLFKYDITHFNSVESEQAIVSLVLVLYFFVLAVVRAHENPVHLLFKPAFFVQAVSGGFGAVLNSYAYSFAPASIITTASRAFSVLFAILSGRIYFKERGFVVKLLLFCAIAGGLLLLL